VIAVQSANYGRTTNGSVCPHSQIRTTACGATGSLSTVKGWCDGKISCEIQASNLAFGDPCPNTYKYLQVGYKCIILVVPTNVIICEHKSRTILCSGSSIINVLRANYGRTTDGKVCPHPSILTTNCSASKTLTIVQGLCQGKPRCELHASNGFFGDPCVYTYKYLEVYYSCITPVGSTNVIVCSHKSRTIVCSGGSTINVLRANYGRTADARVCPHPSIQTTNCSASNSLPIVKGWCQGKTTCVLYASHGFFGDPCIGTFKYLEVDYTCS